MKNIVFSLFIIGILASCHKENITISTSAHDVFYLENKGASMPIRVHGKTESKVFMMIVHGGPGGNAPVYRTDYVVENVESQFAIVYWDQRNGGYSQGTTNAEYDSIDDFIEDFEKVVVLLKKRYGSDISIFVNGHSWGGFLTPAFLQKGTNQTLVKGWIQSAGAHNIPLLNEYSRQMQLDKADIEIAANRNVAEWTKIKNYANSLTLPLTKPQSLELNQNASKAENLTEERPKPNPQYTKSQIKDNLPLDFEIMQSLYNPVPKSLINTVFAGRQVSEKMNVINLPTLLLFGKHDYICPAKLADDIESRIKSVYKKKVILRKSGHGLMAGADEKEYWDEVKQFINQFK